VCDVAAVKPKSASSSGLAAERGRRAMRQSNMAESARLMKELQEKNEERQIVYDAGRYRSAISPEVVAG
jgi:hypothetical protein